jgi:cytochrome P450
MPAAYHLPRGPRFGTIGGASAPPEAPGVPERLRDGREAAMEYSPFSDAVQDDPYPTYRWLRDEAPCYHNEELDFWALSRFEDVWNATLDWRTYSSALGPLIENRGEVPGEFFSILGMDPPRHTRIRNLVSRGFTPRRIAALEPAVRRIIEGHLEPLAELSECDIQRDFGVRFPMDVISLLLGIPEADRDWVRDGYELVLHREPGDTGRPPGAVEKQSEMREYLGKLLDDRRVRPRDDLISVIAQARFDEGGRRTRLSDDETIAFCDMLAGAGAETTAKLFGNAVVLLARESEPRRLLREEPERIPGAVEEILRYEAPSQYQGRVATRDVQIHGKTIPAGKRVALVTGAACRDEREFPDPDRLDLARRPERHLHFGYGQHLCIGKSLARLEARIALEEFGRCFPDYEVDPAGLVRVRAANVRGYRSVRIRR